MRMTDTPLDVALTMGRQELARQVIEANAEITRLRLALDRIQDGLRSSDNAKNVDTVGRAREIALAALNQC